MAVANGYGKVATSGLVFMCDIGDSANSYRGEPTINYQWNSGYEVTPWTVGGTNTDVTNTVNQGPIKGAKTWKFEKTGTSNQWNGWESSYGGIWTGNAGDVWTTSYWYKTNNDAGMEGFSIGAFYKPDWSAPYNTTVLSSVSSIIADGQWHYNYTTTQFNENYSNAIIVDGPSWGYSGQAGELYINGLQWEKKSHPTPFAYGTRSATQGLLPLVGNSTIDLSNVSYDSTAQKTFDGTNDYIEIPFETILNDCTIEVIFKATSTGYYQYPLAIRNNSVGSSYAFYMDMNDPDLGTAGQTMWTYWNSGGTPYSAIPRTGTYGDWNDSTYRHYVFTRSTSVSPYTLHYMNGNLVGNISRAGDQTTQFGNGAGYKLYLGSINGATGFFKGNLPIVKIYNRVLSSAEVRQNYNNYKTRFNLS